MGWVEGGLLEYSRRCFSLFPIQPFSTNSIKRSNPLPPTSDFRKLEKFGKSLERRSCFSQQSPILFYSSVQEIGFCFIYAAIQHLNIPCWCCHFHPYTAILDIANVAEEITMTMLAEAKMDTADSAGPPSNTIFCLYCRATIAFPGLPANRFLFFWKKQIGRKLCLGISSICSPSTTSCTRSRASSTAHCKLTPTNQDP